MRGAPHVGFSTTIRKINSGTSFDVRRLPTCVLAPDDQPPVPAETGPVPPHYSLRCKHDQRLFPS